MVGSAAPMAKAKAVHTVLSFSIILNGMKTFASGGGISRSESGSSSGKRKCRSSGPLFHVGETLAGASQQGEPITAYQSSTWFAAAFSRLCFPALRREQAVPGPAGGVDFASVAQQPYWHVAESPTLSHRPLSSSSPQQRPGSLLELSWPTGPRATLPADAARGDGPCNRVESPAPSRRRNRSRPVDLDP